MIDEISTVTGDEYLSAGERVFSALLAPAERVAFTLARESGNFLSCASLFGGTADINLFWQNCVDKTERLTNWATEHNEDAETLSIYQNDVPEARILKQLFQATSYARGFNNYLEVLLQEHLSYTDAKTGKVVGYQNGLPPIFKDFKFSNPFSSMVRFRVHFDYFFEELYLPAFITSQHLIRIAHQLPSLETKHVAGQRVSHDHSMTDTITNTLNKFADFYTESWRVDSVS